MKTLLGFILLTIANAALAITAAERTTEHWNSVTKMELDETRKAFENINTNKAKNIILLVGDGMSLSTVTAGRIAIGQKMKKDGEEHVTSLDRMPYSGFLKTYSVDHQTPDSAATATAFLTGIKTNSGALGVNAKGSSCTNVQQNKVTSLLEYAVEAGKSTGVVTTTRVQHATPAATYSHIHKRSIYSDKAFSISERRRQNQCPDISTQLFNKRNDIQVILGGGRAHMIPTNLRDPEYPKTFGERRDRRNLINEWVEDMSKDHVARYVWNKTEFDAVDPQSTDYLMGLFSPFDTEYAIRKRTDVAGEPTLPEMAEKAIKILQKNENGFFLLIESGKIDHGHHQSRAQYALEEFHELDKTLEIARALTNEEETLIVTTADHGHMFMIGGNSRRGNNVYGLAPSHTSPKRAKDGKYYTSLIYGNGPGHQAARNPNARERQAVNKQTVLSPWYHQQSAVPLPAETHSAEDVVVLASGPMSHLLTGIHEQTHIASVARFAACLGNKHKNEPHCRTRAVNYKLLEEEMRSQSDDNGEDDSFVVDDWMY